MSLTRVFVSAEITAKEELSKEQHELVKRAQMNMPKIKVVDQGNFHFTIVFIGEVDSSSLELIISDLSKFKFKSFDFNFSQISGFPDSKNAKIVWIGVDKEADRKIFEIQQSVVKELSAFAPKEKNTLVPHITLFRIKSGAVNLESIMEKNRFQINIQDRINEIALKKSVLTPSGPKYSNIITVKGV